MLHPWHLARTRGSLGATARCAATRRGLTRSRRCRCRHCSRRACHAACCRHRRVRIDPHVGLCDRQRHRQSIERCLARTCPFQTWVRRVGRPCLNPSASAGQKTCRRRRRPRGAGASCQRAYVHAPPRPLAQPDQRASWPWPSRVAFWTWSWSRHRPSRPSRCRRRRRRRRHRRWPCARANRGLSAGPFWRIDRGGDQSLRPCRARRSPARRVLARGT